MSQAIYFRSCPFCGEDEAEIEAIEQVEADKWQVSVMCQGCNVSVSPSYASDSINSAINDAADKWNTRVGQVK